MVNAASIWLMYERAFKVYLADVQNPLHLYALKGRMIILYHYQIPITELITTTDSIIFYSRDV